ncbi:Splicing factor 3A subunit 1 [Thelohanellus kitauei]|uniref:Splicing factor 3A subunit 1 n=1 Tax=Thelohanellus kitauei TaxID=669202 RepID=A0A0C2MAQ1_THEKT|nr:Splicing factor 3A subunit 1 [Thelohanellus kitauei]
MSADAQTQNGHVDEKKSSESSNADIPIISDIGIIYPPPEVRSIIEKTAEFVHKNGMEFEDKIRQREVQNLKFSFLNRNDPYFMYYKHILYEYTLYPNREKIPEKPSFLTCLPQIEKKMVQETVPIKKWKQLIEPTDSSHPPNPPQPEFINEQLPLAPVDLDTVKITAQFVARNGRQFLQSLLQREMKNYIFDFLKPQHNIYPFFIKLVEQYSKILAPSNNTITALRKEAIDRSAVLEKVRVKYEWLRYTNREARSEKSKDKALAGQVDWHEFVVVETITFKEDEQANLPPPVSIEQLGARLISQERQEKMKVEPPKVVEVEKVEKAEEIKTIVAEEVETKPKEPVIIKNYEKKVEKTKQEKLMMISPITGEHIPADKMEQHLKQTLLDPKYKEQRQKYLEEKRQLDLMASTGPSIKSHLKNLAQRRSDIFGPGHEETGIGMKIDEQEAPHVKKAAPVNFESVAQNRSSHNPPVEKSYDASNRKKPEPPIPVAQLPPPLPQKSYPYQQPVNQAPYYGLPPPLTTQPSHDGRPAQDEPLIPEEEFLASYGAFPINIQVRIPDLPELVRKNGWQLQGQIQHMTINLSDTISSLKNQLTQITGMPTSKQKILIGASRFAKDNLTLAYYNIHSNTYIALQLKERGGRR